MQKLTDIIVKYMENDNLVSILIPLYNAEKTIKKTIESAISQTYTNIEIVIVDDCSTDKSIDIIKEYKDTRIRIFFNDRNLGMHKNWKKCIDVSKGKFIHFLHCDDILSEDCIEKKVRKIKEDNRIVLVTSSSIVINSDDRIILRRKRVAKETVENGYLFAKKAFLLGNIYGEPSNVLIRKDIISELDFCFNEKIKYSVDFDFFLRLSVLGYIGCLPEYLNMYRTSNSNKTSSFGFKEFLIDDNRLIQSILDNKVLRINALDLIIHKIQSTIRIIARIVFQVANNR